MKNNIFLLLLSNKSIILYAMIFLRIIIVIFLLYQPILAQNKNIAQKRRDLKKVRDDIELYKSRIKSENAREASILDILPSISMR